MRRGDAFVRFMAWVYTAGFAFVVIALDLSVFSAPWQAPHFGMTNIAVNLPHIVIVAVAIVVLVRAWRLDVRVTQLGEALAAVHRHGAALEHIYDF